MTQIITGGDPSIQFNTVVARDVELGDRYSGLKTAVASFVGGLCVGCSRINACELPSTYLQGPADTIVAPTSPALKLGKTVFVKLDQGVPSDCKVLELGGQPSANELTGILGPFRDGDKVVKVTTVVNRP